MPSVQPRGDKFQLRVKHKLLPKPFFFTFPTNEAAAAYGEQLHSLLQRGIVPMELLEQTPNSPRTLMGTIVTGYLATSGPSPTDRELLNVIHEEVKTVRESEVTYAWVEQYVRGLKLKSHLAPGTIRKRVGSLARVLDWHHRSTTGRDQVNPFRLLPRGYSTYSEEEGLQVAPKVDIERDRRMTPEELKRTRAALAGEKAEGKERPLRDDVEFRALFEVIRETGLRLQEAYTLRRQQVDLVRGLIHVEGSKGHRGARKPRMVPMRPALVTLLTAYCKGREGLLFPTLWDGTPGGRRETKSRLVARFTTLFAYAKVADFTEHDLRHCACCDWYEMRNAQGHWTFSDIEIAKIMGWSSLKMCLRYASFRGEDLSSRLL